MNINCSYSNPKQLQKIGDDVFLVNIYTQDRSFQFESSTCSMPETASTTAGFTSGEIINGVFLFLILMVLSFNLFLKMLYPKK